MKLKKERENAKKIDGSSRRGMKSQEGKKGNSWMERCRIFFLEFQEMVSGRRKPRKSSGRGGTLWKVSLFPIVDDGQKGRHEQLRFVRKQIGEPLCPIDSIDRRRIDPIQSRAFFVWRGTRERGTGVVVTEGAGEASILARGRCISVITERPNTRGPSSTFSIAQHVPDTRLRVTTYLSPFRIVFFLLLAQRYSRSKRSLR